MSDAGGGCTFFQGGTRFVGRKVHCYIPVTSLHPSLCLPMLNRNPAFLTRSPLDCYLCVRNHRDKAKRSTFCLFAEAWQKLSISRRGCTFVLASRDGAWKTPRSLRTHSCKRHDISIHGQLIPQITFHFSE